LLRAHCSSLSPTGKEIFAPSANLSVLFEAEVPPKLAIIKQILSGIAAIPAPDPALVRCVGAVLDAAGRGSGRAWPAGRSSSDASRSHHQPSAHTRACRPRGNCPRTRPSRDAKVESSQRVKTEGAEPTGRVEKVIANRGQRERTGVLTQC